MERVASPASAAAAAGAPALESEIVFVPTIGRFFGLLALKFALASLINAGFGFGAAGFGFKFTGRFGNFFTFLTVGFGFGFDSVPVFGAFTSIIGTFN